MIVENMYQFIGDFFPIIRLQAQSKQRFLNEVVLPAAKLASKIQLAASIYEFRLQPNPFFWEYESVRMDDHKIMKMVDVKTRKTIKGSSAIVQDRQHRIGVLVLTLEPSLRRINKHQRSTLLRPEVNLIEVDQPLAKRIKPSTEDFHGRC